jgi:hypothetical protein
MKNLAAWIIFLSFPIILGGIWSFIKILFRKPHPLIGKSDMDFAFLDQENRPVSLADMKGKILILEPFEEIENAQIPSFGLIGKMEKWKGFDDPKLQLVYIYSGSNRFFSRVLEKKNIVLPRLLFDTKYLLKEYFGNDYLKSSLILDQNGCVRSVPMEQWGGNHDKKVVMKIRNTLPKV